MTRVRQYIVSDDGPSKMCFAQKKLRDRVSRHSRADMDSLTAPLADLAAPFLDKWRSINPTTRLLIMFLITRIISAWIKRRFGPKPAPARKGAVKEATDSTAFDAAIADAKAAGAVAVVDFTASWCGPCKRIAPQFAKMSLKYGDVRFLKVDVDRAKDVAAKAGVGCMPTFMFFKGARRSATPSRART